MQLILPKISCGGESKTKQKSFNLYHHGQLFKSLKSIYIVIRD